mmetsp:Transcript_18957/g.34368  ORF Transcript_18957/g.34368 Transcript_18957/m.34368 type:complete len:255 (-) Transcript_18957:205-969(-)
MDRPGALAGLVGAVVETQPSGLPLHARQLHFLTSPSTWRHGDRAGHAREVRRFLRSTLLALADDPAMDRPRIPQDKVALDETRARTRVTAEARARARARAVMRTQRRMNHDLNHLLGAQEYGVLAVLVPRLEHTPVADPLHFGMALPEAGLGFVRVRARYHLQATDLLRDVDKRNHPLDAVELRFTEGVLIEVQTFRAGKPPLALRHTPPRPPDHDSVHRGNELLSAPDLPERLSDTGQPAHMPRARRLGQVGA